MSNSNLEPHWQRTTALLNLTEPQTNPLFETLTTRYQEPHRHYHTLAHLDTMFTLLEEIQPDLQNPAALHLAIWYHDSIYDTQAQDNEAQSAQFMHSQLSSLSLAPNLLSRTADLILLTQHHQPSADDTDGQLLIDLDLAILGTDPDTYQTYAENIRKEYAWVPEDAYRTGRIGILQKFLEREKIYHTEPFQQTREAQARTNLENEIETLQ